MNSADQLLGISTQPKNASVYSLASAHSLQPLSFLSHFCFLPPPPILTTDIVIFLVL